MSLSQRSGSEWAAASASRLETAGCVVCFPEMSEESFSNPRLPCWEPVVGEASHRTYDSVDKRDSMRFSQIKKGSLCVISYLFVRMLSLLKRYLFKAHLVALNASGCH